MKCDWCNQEFTGAWVKYDETLWHPVCLAEYIHAKDTLRKKQRYRDPRVPNLNPVPNPQHS